MSRCHDNRKARLKRDKKFLARLASKRFDRKACKEASVSPDYYTVHYHIVTRNKKGVRLFDLRKMTFRVVPNAKYHRTIAVLLAACQGVTVTIPPVAKE